MDHGLYPSRFSLILRMIREISSKRKIDILVTTHNPTLINTLGSEIVLLIVVVHRDSVTGESQLTIVKNPKNIPQLMTSDSLVKVATNGSVEKITARSKS